MTFTRTRYKTYAEYLNADLNPEGNFRLLSSGEIVELPPEDERNISIADELAFTLKQLVSSKRLVKISATELQVHPVGDTRVNRKPDIVVLRPAHIELMGELNKSTILFGMPAPVFVAEVVSPGGPTSENYRRDYDWKRVQYERWNIPEYWIIDRHRAQVTVLILKDGQYVETVYRDKQKILSQVFPSLDYRVEQLLAGEN
ncbi:MAG: Uma2 family endonuclease [Cyanobacteria bacterium J06627_32]